MRSDDRVNAAQQALQGQGAAFRAAVESTCAAVRAYLAAHGARTEERARETALELGGFAGGRIDVGRFASVLDVSRVLEPAEEAIVRRCVGVMEELLAKEDLFLCHVGPNHDLRTTVDDALANVGRAFGAARVFHAVKIGAYHADEHGPALMRFPFRQWSRAERLVAPPMVVSVDGSALHAAALADLLDGRQKIALVVSGTSTWAPLARLITPHLFVMQTDSAADLTRLAAANGPGVAAVLSTEAARFVHDPAVEHLEVTHLRADTPRSAVGGWSVWQQQEELALLRQLAAAEVLASRARAQAGAGSSGLPNGAAQFTDVDELTSWMLSQAGFAAGAT